MQKINWENWKPGDLATLLFIIQEKRILLIHKKRGLGSGKINGPGGRIEAGETFEQCAVREVKEELGITPLDPVERGQLYFQFVDGYSLKCVVFSATKFEGQIIETDEATPLWTPIDRIPYDRMWADDRTWIPLMLQGHQFTGRYLFDQDNMLEYDLSKTNAS